MQDPELYLSERQDKLVIIDEVQRMPQLFPLLRSLIDRHRVAGRFMLLGSASPQLLQQSSESLAGRIAYLEVQPLTWLEIQGNSLSATLAAGGLPRYAAGHQRPIRQPTHE